MSDHGTKTRYGTGCHCDPCRAAGAAYAKRHALAKSRGQVFSVPAGPTIRRIRALQAIGWTLKQIAAEMGAHVSFLDQLVKRTTVRPKTAERVDGVYQRLSGTPGTSDYSRAVAKARGWAPPLAWDDIDHDDAPQGVRGRDSRGIDLDEFMHLVRSGESLLLSAKKVGGNPETVLRAAEREGRVDVADLIGHEGRVHRYAREAA